MSEVKDGVTDGVTDAVKKVANEAEKRGSERKKKESLGSGKKLIINSLRKVNF